MALGFSMDILTHYHADEQKARLEECNNACIFKAKAAIPELMKRILENVKPLLPPTSEFTKGTLLSDSGAPPMPAGLPAGFSMPGPGAIPGPGVGGVPLPGGRLLGSGAVPGAVPGNLPKLG